MTALYVPDGIVPGALIGALAARKIIIAGGLHKDIKTKLVLSFFRLFWLPFTKLDFFFFSRYVRFGHMGESVVRSERDDMTQLLSALKSAFAEVSAAHKWGSKL